MAHVYSSDPVLCMVLLRGHRTHVIVKYNGKNLLSYLDETESAAGASCMKNVALLKNKNDGALKSSVVQLGWRSSERRAEMCGAQHGYCSSRKVRISFVTT